MNTLITNYQLETFTNRLAFMYDFTKPTANNIQLIYNSTNTTLDQIIAICRLHNIYGFALNHGNDNYYLLKPDRTTTEIRTKLRRNKTYNNHTFYLLDY